MPKIKGDPMRGMQQLEKNFDYETFYPMITSPGFDNYNIDNSNATGLGFLFGNIISDSGVPSEYENFDSPSRVRRNQPSNNMKTNTFTEQIDIKTACPSQIQKLYESEELKCSDLRKLIKFT